uniref:Uncharacterized protein n=1 Tax=Cannabis sativa TaxID=3483 RepID=A0A803P4P3_CANSA
MYKDLSKENGSHIAINKIKERVHIEVEQTEKLQMVDDTFEQEAKQVINEQTSEESGNDDEHHDYQLTRDRERRNIIPPNRFGYDDSIFYALNISELDGEGPGSYEEAMVSIYKLEWNSTIE